MAEIRKFDPDSADELQRLVREQIGDTMMPRPAGAPQTDEAEPEPQPEAGPAAAELGTYGSFLSYGGDSAP
ncbi:hypothetical protein G7085_15550 [Tessaracoccus sp. HDW20]|uniref:hypothetical protein n=1 Tax=Tessaracoccus coleopterorum TaxID=2714950 RepID=UPI0018D35FF8|nr:hypothetical protein [Tessaracoccus coleopterorum]NHB85543.1 hypothetical protein [Tessaracoccus coleopterorum]